MVVLKIKLRTIPTLIILAVVLITLRAYLPFGTSSAGEGWITPNIYERGDPLEIIVNKVESDLTQLPFAYYDLPFTCPPTMYKKPLHLSLNEIIRGDRKWQSDYQLQFGQDEDCKILCARKTLKDGVKNARELVKKGYVSQWLIDDNLPAATTFISTTDHKKYYASGFPLGFVDPDTGKVYLNNHVMLVIRFHAIDDDHFTIVGLEVYPKSVSDYHCPGAARDYEHFELVVPENDDELTMLPFTYSVYWREEFNVEWKDRFNFFFNSGELSNEVSAKFHWISLANSFGIVLLASFIVTIIFIRLSKQGQSYDEIYDYDVSDSKKTPLPLIAKNWLESNNTKNISSLIVLISMGVQCIFTIVGSLTISCSLSKLHNVRNTVLSMALFFFLLGASMASYVGSYLLIDAKNNSKKGSLRKTQVQYTPMFAVICGSLLPGLVMISTLVLNCIVWAHDSTTALPFGTIVLFITLYFIICIPLSYLGGEFAAKKFLRSKSKDGNHGSYVDKETTGGGSLTNFKSKGKKLVTDSMTIFSILASGIFPFIIIYVELQFVYKSVWLEKTTFYYYYSFLLANIVLLCVVVCEISIIVCYTMMTIMSQKEMCNTNWRWKCYQIGSSAAWFMEFYSLYYVFWVLNIRGFSSILLSVCYSTIFNILCGLGMGSLGYMSSYWFVKYISVSHSKDI